MTKYKACCGRKPIVSEIGPLMRIRCAHSHCPCNTEWGYPEETEQRWKRFANNRAAWIASAKENARVLAILHEYGYKIVNWGITWDKNNYAVLFYETECGKEFGGDPKYSIGQQKVFVMEDIRDGKYKRIKNE